MKITTLAFLFFILTQNGKCASAVYSDTNQLELALIRKNTEIVRKVNLNHQVKIIKKGATKAEAIKGKVKIIDEHTIAVGYTIIPIQQIRELYCTIGKADGVANFGVIGGAIGIVSGVCITDVASKKIDEPFSQILAIGAGIGITMISVVPFVFGGVYKLSNKKHYNLYQYDLVVLNSKK